MNNQVPLVKRPRPAVMPAHGAIVLESRHASDFSGELLDPFAKFHFTLAGKAEWTVNDTQSIVTPGMLNFIAAGIPHRQRDFPDEPVTLYFIHVRPELLPSASYVYLSRNGYLPLDLKAYDSGILEQIRTLFQQMIYEQDVQRPGWEALVAARVLDLTALHIQLLHNQSERQKITIAESSTSPIFSGDSLERVRAYTRYQDAHFFRNDSLENAANAVHLGRRRFTELFKQETGESWNQRLLRLRLEHAERLLQHSNRSVTAIAFACGFEDISHFHHSFKKKYAVTPAQYRQRVKLPDLPAS